MYENVKNGYREFDRRSVVLFKRCLLNGDNRCPCYGKVPETRFYCIRVQEVARV